MPNPIDPSEDDRHAAQVSALRNAVLAIEQDLNRVAEMIERMIGLVEASDGELVARLNSARDKAADGVRLSKRLSKEARRHED
jgi:hypothetical protein